MKVRILAIAMLAVSVVLSACDTGTAANPTATTAPSTGANPTATTAAEAPTATGAAPASGRAVVVSSKDFTEEIIIGEMYAQALENAGIKVERKLNLGSTDI